MTLKCVCIVCSEPLTSFRCCIKCWQGLPTPAKQKWWKDTDYGKTVTDAAIADVRAAVHVENKTGDKRIPRGPVLSVRPSPSRRLMVRR